MPGGENTKRICPELLKAGKTISVCPQGKSMIPLLDGINDSVIIKPKKSPIKINDLILYNDKENRLVVHRVWDIRKSGYVLLGDGNIQKEFPIKEDDVYGVCVAVKRNGKTISTNAISYCIYTKLWRILYPIRRYLLKILSLKKWGKK